MIPLHPDPKVSSSQPVQREPVIPFPDYIVTGPEKRVAPQLVLDPSTMARNSLVARQAPQPVTLNIAPRNLPVVPGTTQLTINNTNNTRPANTNTMSTAQTPKIAALPGLLGPQSIIRSTTTVPNPAPTVPDPAPPTVTAKTQTPLWLLAGNNDLPVEPNPPQKWYTSKKYVAVTKPPPAKPPPAKTTKPISMTVTTEKFAASGDLVVTTNPYIGFQYLSDIARTREIHISGTKSEMAEQLFNYDKIMPDWLNGIYNTDARKISTLNYREVPLWKTMHNIPHELENFEEISAYGSIMKNFDNLTKRREVLYEFRRCKEAHKCVVRHKFPDSYDYLSVMDAAMMYAIIETGTFEVHPALAIKAQRYKQYKSLRFGLSVILSEIYGTTELMKMAAMPKHPLEDLVVNMDDYTSEQIIDYLGMSVPLAFANSVSYYVNRNIAAYKDVVGRVAPTPETTSTLLFMTAQDRINYLSTLKDIEIFQLIGIYVRYESRHELVRNISAAFDTRSFMFPVIRDTTKSLNSHTLLGDPITDTTLTMVCYGTPAMYQTYEIEELLNSFHRNDDGAILFKDPHHTDQTFDIAVMRELVNLLRALNSNDLIERLANHIDQGIQDAEERTANDSIVQNKFKLLSPTEKTQFERFLMDIFLCGMYMRRWKGPGHPYPLKYQETNAKEIPDVKVSEMMEEHKNNVAAMSRVVKDVYNNLKICRYNNTGKIEEGRIKFDEKWNVVYKGETVEACIRMASAWFVGTAYHYTKVLFNKRIPGLDVKEVEAIT